MHIEVLRYDNNGGEKMQFETERIMVRPFNMCDSEEVYEYCSDKEIGLLAGWAAHQSLDETKRTLSSWIEKGDHNAIVYKENNKVIGYIAIYPDSEENREDTRELGYAINKKFQGLGIMTEVLKKTVEVLLESEINNIWACCFKENVASKRVIEKCGFVFQQEGTFYSDSLKKEFLSLEYRRSRSDS